MSEFPNLYYSTQGSVGNSTGITTKSFGIISKLTIIRNLGSKDIYMNPQGRGLCTTDDISIPTGSNALILKDIALSKVTFYTTSTGAAIAFSLSGVGDKS